MLQKLRIIISMHSYEEYTDVSDAREVYHCAWAFAEEVHEYMELMRYTPPLKADIVNCS